MIKKKIVVSLLVLLILTVGVFGTAFADLDRDETPKSLTCPACNEGIFYLYTTIYGPWIYLYQEPCQHEYLRGNDYHYSRNVYKYYKCSECSYTDHTTSTQYNIICDGW